MEKVRIVRVISRKDLAARMITSRKVRYENGLTFSLGAILRKAGVVYGN
jgi:hypothetical protein